MRARGSHSARREAASAERRSSSSQIRLKRICRIAGAPLRVKFSTVRITEHGARNDFVSLAMSPLPPPHSFLYLFGSTYNTISIFFSYFFFFFNVLIEDLTPAAALKHCSLRMMV